MELLAEGAEAKIFVLDKDTLLKQRLEKPYRVELLDKKLRKFRTRREFKVLTKLEENKVNAPKPLELNDKDFSFTMQYLNGNVLKEVLNEKLLEKAFHQIIKLHQSDITHGDLTTLNMIEVNNSVYIIDFGLADFTTKIEDKAVDLNLFFTCIKNEHPDLFKHKEKLLNLYCESLIRGDEILQRLEKIEHRGRNK